MHFVGREYDALAILCTHSPQRFIWCICGEIEQVSDDWPSRRSRRKRRPSPSDKTTDKVQRQTGEADTKSMNPHNLDLTKDRTREAVGRLVCNRC